MREQKQSIGRVRKLLRKSHLENPFANNKQTDAILARYENNFWVPVFVGKIFRD